MDRSPSHVPGSRAVIALFAAMLLAPLALALAGLARPDVTFLTTVEHRAPFVAPPVSSGALATGGWERDVERQIADDFPLRTRLVDAYDYAKWRWFGDLRDQSIVIAGRDGWLFYGAPEERAFITGGWPSSQAQLVEIADRLAARAAWCRAHRIAYVFVIAPNKSTIYARELPSTIRVAPPPTPTDRLVPLLRARAVTVVDPRAALITAARDGEVYSRGDTHWNDAGAYVAYGVSLPALAAAGVRNTIAPNTVGRTVADGSADLLALAGIRNLATNPWVVVTYPHKIRIVTTPETARDPQRRVETVVDDPSLPTLVGFGDSFMVGLRQFLAEDFRASLFVQHESPTDVHFDTALLERVRPNVVVDELVERNFVSEGLR